MSEGLRLADLVVIRQGAASLSTAAAYSSDVLTTLSKDGRQTARARTRRGALSQ